MKHIKNSEIKTILDKPLLVPISDEGISQSAVDKLNLDPDWVLLQEVNKRLEAANPEFEFHINAQLKSKPAKLTDCLRLMVLTMPREQASIMVNLINGTRLVNACEDAVDELVIKDKLFTWAVGMLKDDKVGATRFNFTLPSILSAMEGKDILAEEEE